MARAGRFAARLLLAAALGAGGYVAWVCWWGSPAAVDLLPQGAIGVLEVHDAERVSRTLAGTRFAAAFAASASRQWLERSDVVRAFDAVRSEIGRASGVRLGRDSAFDLLGSEVAVGWYPPAGDGATVSPWVAGSRLSVRGWIAASALRLAVKFGLGPAGVGREEVAGRTVYSLPGGAGESLHVFLAGRVLFGGSERALVLRAAATAGSADAAVTGEPSWRMIRAALPARGEAFVWVRGGVAIPGIAFAGAGDRGASGALVRAGRTLEIDVAAETSPHLGPGGVPAGGAEPLPAISLLRQMPLLLLTSSDPVPAVLGDLLQSRRRAVIQRGAGTAASMPALQPGDGYAVAITESAGGAGLFPAPHGFVLIGMASAAESARALPLLFPPGARSATSGGTRALATRESFPLAGAFDLWGAAIGPHLVFATDTSLIEAVRAGAAAATTPEPGRPPWRVTTVAMISMEKALPLLRRWRAPLSGLVAAKWPQAPDVVQDLGLLASIGTVRLAAGSDERFRRAALTLDLHDLPAGR